jgi:hypothetical protein
MAFCPTVYYYKTTITCHYKKESLDSDGQQFHQYQLNFVIPDNGVTSWNEIVL